VLHVGDLQIRRNLTTALDAVLRLRAQSIELPLLVCAGVDRGIGASLVAQAREARDPDALVLTGPVSEEALLNLYRGAALLAYPSRYEGFGLPILEAMRCGIPVVGARAASIPEVIGDAGTLVDPVDVDAWQSAIADTLTGGETASRLRQASLTRASRFSWDRTARETLAALRDCATEGRRR
jgi:glycosyltransferase involved in cell wall biosynthesis